MHIHVFYNMTLYNCFGDRIMSKSVKSFRIVGLSFSSIFMKHIPPGCFFSRMRESIPFCKDVHILFISWSVWQQNGSP